MDKASQYLRSHNSKKMDGKEIPFILAGDLNSFPVSSVMSAFHGEDIESETSSWKIPTTFDRFATDETLLTEKQNRYKKIN